MTVVLGSLPTALRSRRAHARAFSLIELMTTTALVGVLSVLATYGVRKYAAHSKTTEATNMMGAISTSVKIAFYHERMSGAIMQGGSYVQSSMGGTISTGGGSKGKGATHTRHAGLCDDSQPVPASLTSIQGHKYQPTSQDWESGDALTGWQCLYFHNDEPQYFQYQYLSSGTSTVSRPHGMGPPPGQAAIAGTSAWNVIAHGDLDGDGVTSYYGLYGGIDANNVLYVAPEIEMIDEDQ